MHCNFIVIQKQNKTKQKKNKQKTNKQKTEH